MWQMRQRFQNNRTNNNNIDRPGGDKMTYTEILRLFGDTCETDKSTSSVFEWDYLHSDVYIIRLRLDS